MSPDIIIFGHQSGGYCPPRASLISSHMEFHSVSDFVAFNFSISWSVMFMVFLSLVVGRLTRKSATPNHALQRTAALAFSCRARPKFDRLSHGVCSAAKPGIRRAFALRRRAHERASGLRSLSLGSLGFRSPVL